MGRVNAFESKKVMRKRKGVEMQNKRGLVYVTDGERVAYVGSEIAALVQ